MESRVRTALRNLIVDEYSLFVPHHGKRPVSELTASAHLARLLVPQFSRSWDIDCEYNRAGLKEIKRDSARARRRPDVIIHRRTGEDSRHNLLILELKITSGRGGGSEKSVQDLLTKFGYRHGLFLHLNWQEAKEEHEPLLNPEWRWFGESADSSRQPVYQHATLAAILAEARLNWAERRRFLDVPNG
ncbi:hypothetical protein KZ829_18615 [Actinoplanes hulinensis]|uniref:Uncharacterized protein n=1 Tax=Actinoplanes hulinensis TaxID=1144547 RepID=A0ABS7B5P3_9ACTN|nr:hypothetical protein [Actinoplanes hulinensis]MBW6435759.1 hypothetical protein [Actinoplanes hulinensis]